MSAERRTIAALACLVMLAACDALLAPTTSDTTTATRPAANLSISAEGGAGITSPVRFTYDAVVAAAPGFYVTEHQERAGGNILKVFMLSTDDGDMFRLYPTADGARLDAIVAFSPQVHGPTDETVSMSSYYQAPQADIAYCVTRMIGQAPGFACSNAANGTLWRVYKLPNGYDGPSEPFDAIDPDAATDATLVELRWKAPGPG